MKKSTKQMQAIIKINIILAFAILLSANTFAWFVYSSHISNNISTKVKAWKIDFENGEGLVVEYITFNIDSLYPGMTPYANTINIVNYGETAAQVNFELQSVKILGQTYTLGTYTQEQLLNMLANDYPFKILFNITDYNLPPNNGSADFEIDATWAYESGNDVLDTQWGHDAYTYAQENPTSSGIEIAVKLTAVQIN